MRHAVFSAIFVALAIPVAVNAAQPQISDNAITIESSALGDAAAGVATRITAVLNIPDGVPSGTPLLLQGSITRGTAVVRNFRFNLPDSDTKRFSFVQVLPAGAYEVEVRLLVPLETEAPYLLGKTTAAISVAAAGKPYLASESDGPEGIVAEGVVSESAGAVRIKPPKRDLALNLFRIDVEVRPPVQKVEFYVDGKKIVTRNEPPYGTELDLGQLPKRVEVRAVGYDAAGRYVDADAWIVNERDTPLEVKLTRTVTPDGVSHFKLSVQNPKGRELRKVELFAADRRLIAFSAPPYAFDIPTARLAGVDFVRASVLDDTNYEATDILFLDGSRYSEEIEVNLVELPVSVSDEKGAAVTDLQEKEFSILEDGKPQKISNFAFATNLPISVGVLVDHSGSMQPRIEAARQAAIDFFRQIIGEKDRAFFGAFSWDPSTISPFVSNVESLESQARSMPAAEGGTALYDAIVSGLYRFRNVQGRKALVLVTDGEDTVSRLGYDDMITYARAARVPLYFIGIGLSPLEFGASSKMKSAAAETGGSAYFIRNVSELKETYARLEQELRTQYLLSYYAQSTKKDEKYRTVEVKVGRKGTKVRTIRGYIP